MSKYIELIETLSNTTGIAAYEQNIQALFEEEGRAQNLEIQKDRLGGIAISKKSEKAKYTVMLAAHMDEIGFMVTKIEDGGFLRLKAIGGWWEHVLLGQKLQVTTRDKAVFQGIVGSVPVHLLKAEQRKNVKMLDELFLDLGFESKEDVEKAGIQLGDMVTPIATFEQLAANPNRYIGKAFDDRVGCAINIAVMRELAKKELDVNVVFAGTIQEEVGTRGAKTMGQMIEPDLAIILDCGMTGDFPGAPQDQLLDKLGKGPVISLMDGTFIGHPKWRSLIQETSKQAEIPFQNTIMTGGGSDGGPIHTTANGVPSVYMGTPVRYIHAHYGMIDVRDFDQLVQLLVRVIESLDTKKVEALFE